VLVVEGQNIGVVVDGGFMIHGVGDANRLIRVLSGRGHSYRQ